MGTFLLTSDHYAVIIQDVFESSLDGVGAYDRVAADGLAHLPVLGLVRMRDRLVVPKGVISSFECVGQS